MADCGPQVTGHSLKTAKWPKTTDDRTDKGGANIINNHGQTPAARRPRAAGQPIRLSSPIAHSSVDWHPSVDGSGNGCEINMVKCRFWRLKWWDSIHILRARRLWAPWGGLMPKSLPPNYRPTDKEEFMNPLQLEYFRQKLLQWRAELLADSTGTLRHLKEESLLKPDLTDRASLETERAIELRTRDRERKLISKIDAALSRIDIGTYGFCEETEQPIGIRRLEARPIATLSIEAQERHERMERTYRDE
jgi:DnaK suppressor protein